MIIVLVMDQFDNGHDGITVSGQRFAEELRKKGHEVRIVSTGLEKEFKYIVNEYRIPIVTRLAYKQGSIIAKPDDGVLRRAFQGADVVHFMSFWPVSHAGLRIAREMGIPATSAFHTQPENITYNIGMKDLNFLNTFIYRVLKRSFYRKFRHIHCPSDFIADELRKNKYESELHVISNGVGADFIPNPVERPSEWENRIPILMVGRLSPEKRQDVLISAIQKSGYADRIQLVLAGRGPNEAKYRKMAAAKLAFPPVIGFHSRPDLIRLMNSCDLYVHASDIEIEGISCMEAFACGLVPVISDSPRSATNQYALTPENLFKAGDAADLARKIDYWIGNPVKRTEFGRIYADYAESLRVRISVEKAESMFESAIAEDPAESKKTEKKKKYLIFYKDYPFIPSSFAGKTTTALFVRIATPFLYAILKLFFGLKIKGKRNLRKIKGGAVTVSNHVHNLDCAMVGIALMPWRIHFTSQKTNFESGVVGFLVKHLGGVPIPDNVKYLGYLMEALEKAVGNGEKVHFYPEGSLEEYCTELRPFKRGAFHLAVTKNVPVIPMILTYRKPAGLFRFYRRLPLFNLEIGKPIYPESDVRQKTGIENLMARTYTAMLKMMGGNHPDKGTTDRRADENISA